MKHCLLLLAVLVALVISAPAFAQFVYLDTNGDGLASCNVPGTDDVLAPGTMNVDVYFDTNHNQDGSVAVCDNGGNPLTILSYEVSLLATGTGSVTFNKWNNNLAGYTINLNGGTVGVGLGGTVGLAVGGSAAYIAVGNGTPSAPGLYKLGTLNVTVTGNEQLNFLEAQNANGVSPVAQTAFGTNCDAKLFDNTYRMGPTVGTDFDFDDNCGTEPVTPTQSKTWGQIKDLYR
jgi:hypothetical protein